MKAMRAARLWVLYLAAPLGLAPFILFGLLSFWSFEDLLIPQVESRADIASEGLVRQLEFNASFFGTLGELRDVGAALDETRDAATELSFIAVYDPAGALIAVSPADKDLPAGIGHEDDDEDRAFETDPLTVGDAPPATWQTQLRGVVNQAYLTVTGEPFFFASHSDTFAIGRYLVTEQAVGPADAPLGYVYVGTELSVLAEVRRDIAIETLTIFIAALLIGFECILLLIMANLIRPLQMLGFLDQRLGARDLRYDVDVRGSGRLDELVAETNRFVRRSSERARALGSRLFSVTDSGAPDTVTYPASRFIRLPLFLFFVGETLLRPSLPIFLSELSSPVPLEGSMLAGIAMSVFLFTSILGVLLGGRWAESHGIKQTVVIGMAIIAIGTGIHVFVTDIVMASAARGISGFGYGLTYAASQLYVLRHTAAKRRTTGFSFFFVVVVAAEISGPAIGGILDDRVGATAVFAAAAAVMVLAVLLALWILPSRLPNLPDVAPASAPQEPEDQDDPAPVFLRRNLRFVTLVACFSVPGKMMLNGALFLAVPLAVAAMGQSATETGRIIMTYGVVILLISPILARLADRYALSPVYTFGGTLIAAAGLLLPGLVDGLWPLYVAVALFGLGQAMSVPAQMTLLLGLTERECRVLGAGVVMGRYRFYERLGSLLGPLLVSAIMVFASAGEAIFILGLLSLAAGAVGTAYFLAVGNRDEEDAIDALLVKG